MKEIGNPFAYRAMDLCIVPECESNKRPYMTDYNRARELAVMHESAVEGHEAVLVQFTPANPLTEKQITEVLELTGVDLHGL